MASDPDFEAEKAVASANRGGMSSWFSANTKEDKLEEAAQLYETAANGFKRAQQLRKAAQAFEKAGELYLSYGEKYKAKSAFIKAASSYADASTVVSSNPLPSISSLSAPLRSAPLGSEEAIAEQEADKRRKQHELLNPPKASEDVKRDNRDALRVAQRALSAAEDEQGNTQHQKAKVLEQIAGIHVVLENYEEAENTYGLAGVAYGTQALPIRTFIAGGEKFAKAGAYRSAARMYEAAVAKEKSDPNPSASTAGNAVRYLCKAAFYHFATGDFVTTRRALENYCNIDRKFGQTPEFRLYMDLMEALRANDEKGFRQIREQYQRTAPTDDQRDAILEAKENSLTTPNVDDDFS
ncbi:TPR-like protein [Glarea lozoyensis ATCC 20868]|uniref:Gamma-soluble NSF attachment protein n=1 Tax=Glarea lozoyensis (strain ATCC 20868 / MF5171) TaxID=1116229 RepID=S3CZP0_GLAL2|nr:TPR-like protein [Glarea lozoyensis ATCC 20868]EPE30359.1 TPR-like protein [Glarea lozoyensis ATCC 20868]